MFIAPSILSLHYDNFNQELDELNKNADWLHFDVMDGNFVPNISFGPDIFKTFRRNSMLLHDVHLMVKDPVFYSEVFAKIGADCLTFHYEALNSLKDCEALIDKIHSYYIKAGLSVKPNTDIKLIKPLLNKLDLVLVMSVEPGFGGQKFMPSSLDKVKYLAQYRKDMDLNYLIEIDGGINDLNAYEVVQSGCDVLVAGSYIFNGDIKRNIDLLKNCQGK